MSQPAMKTSERISSEHADSGRSHQRYELLADFFHNKGLPNAMTVDVEEYFQVSAFDPVISRSAWPDIPSRLSLAMDRILGLFDVHGAKATFFTLGWVLDHHPEALLALSERVCWRVRKRAINTMDAARNMARALLWVSLSRAELLDWP